MGLPADFDKKNIGMKLTVIDGKSDIERLKEDLGITDDNPSKFKVCGQL